MTHSARLERRRNPNQFNDFGTYRRNQCVVSTLPRASGMSTPLSGTASVRSVFVDEAATLLGVSRRTKLSDSKAGSTIRTRCGSQRILLDSIQTLLTERRPSGLPAKRPFRGRAAAASDRVLFVRYRGPWQPLPSCRGVHGGPP